MFTPTCNQNPMLRRYLLQPLLLSLFMLSSTSEPDNDAMFHYCSQRNLTCSGQTHNISYPFRLPTDVFHSCGHPGFYLSCSRDNSTLLLTVSGGKEYGVDTIDYDNHEMHITDLNFIHDLNFINDRSFCPQKFTNFTVNPWLFDYSTGDENLTVYLNCSDELGQGVLDLQDISCESAEGRKFYYGFPDEYPVPKDVWDNCCSVVVVPVNQTVLAHLMMEEENKKDSDGSIGTIDIGFGPLLKKGFGLKWKVGGGWCDECKASHGICGYNKSEPDTRTCYCLNATSINWTCGPITEKRSNAGKYIGIGGGVGGVCILGCVFLILFRRRKKLQQPTSSNLLASNSSFKFSSRKDLELSDSNHRTHIFSYDELEEATNGFSASRELGDGGFGTVYKGKLRDGRTVAVKRLYEHNYRRLEQFKNEVDILSNLRHQNLVTLYGCTSRHSRELLLVYEYIPKGTVADHLHGPLASKESLPWSVRMSIAIETADALAYLHAVEPQIIHRDVKTNNILLDTNYHVKVADFGLSRLFPLDATHVSTAPQGTPGYVDPEYHQCYQLTDKSDVYSFGVVLVELISSKPAVDISRHKHEINLANLALTKIQNRLVDDLVDPKLGYEDDSEIRRMINQVAEVAFRCLQLDREMRPSIKEVVVALRGIQDAGYNGEKEGDVSEAQTKEECRLLKSILPCSPDTVADSWESRSTTPNTST